MVFGIEIGLPLAIAGFLIAGAVIVAAGTRMTVVTDRLADRTGLGEAITGAVFLGMSTSLAGIIVSVTAALDGLPELAVSNALGGIAVQTAFLVIADITYGRANLEHAAASMENMTYGALLIALLSLALLAIAGPAVSVLAIHPVSFVLPAVYVFGLRLASQAKSRPMWRAQSTSDTRKDEPDEPRGGVQLRKLLVFFAGLAVAVVSAGLLLEKTAAVISGQTGIAELAVGGIFTAITTSLPELVTTLVAVRRGALTLAVGGIIGGNTFDVLFLAFSDFAYREGSIYHAIPDGYLFFISMNVLMTAILLLGLMQRERHGVGNVGFEGLAILFIYVAGMATLVLL